MSALRIARRLAMLGVLAALLIGVGDRDAPRAERLPELDVLLVVDCTTSMSALDDPAGSRITAARRDLSALVERFETARFTVITVGRDARVELPPTSDRVAVQDVLAHLQVEAPDAGAGSSPERAVPVVNDALEAAAASDRRTVLVYAGDGEDTGPDDGSPFAGVDGRIGAAVVLGYGTEPGGVMPLTRVAPGRTPPTPETAGALVPDVRTGQPAVSHADPANLTAIADEVEGRYLPADGSEDLAGLVGAARGRRTPHAARISPGRQLSWVWGLLLLALVLPELRAGFRQWLAARRETAPVNAP